MNNERVILKGAAHEDRHLATPLLADWRHLDTAILSALHASPFALFTLSRQTRVLTLF